MSHDLIVRMDITKASIPIGIEPKGVRMYQVNLTEFSWNGRSVKSWANLRGRYNENNLIFTFRPAVRAQLVSRFEASFGERQGLTILNLFEELVASNILANEITV
jgi:hypothetical protein